MCDWVVTIIVISGVRVVPFTRLVCLGMIWNTFDIVDQCFRFNFFNCLDVAKLSRRYANVLHRNKKKDMSLYFSHSSGWVLEKPWSRNKKKQSMSFGEGYRTGFDLLS